MKILLFGKGGQVGWELQRSLAPLGEVIALDFASVGLCGNFADLPGLAATVRAVAPDVIVNAAAYTAVDKAEAEPDLARTINPLAPGVLADEAQSIGAWLVHYSTDYVFDGEQSAPYTETDIPAPRSAYGRSKLAGEEAIRTAGCQHLIFRTSWVFAARGNNFAKTMLRLARERDELRVIADQFGAPTGADLIADVTALALYCLLNTPRECRSDFSPTPNVDVSPMPDLRAPLFGSDVKAFSGTYHLVASGETTWHGYAQYVINEALRFGATLKASPESIHAIGTADYFLPASRPSNSRLANSKLCNRFRLTLPPWQLHVQRLIAELIESTQS